MREDLLRLPEDERVGLGYKVPVEVRDYFDRRAQELSGASGKVYAWQVITELAMRDKGLREELFDSAKNVSLSRNRFEFDHD